MAGTWGVCIHVQKSETDESWHSACFSYLFSSEPQLMEWCCHNQSWSIASVTQPKTMLFMVTLNYTDRVYLV